MEKDYEGPWAEWTTNSISCTLRGPSCTGTSEREWKRASSAKPERTSPPWRRTTRRSPKSPSTTISRAMRAMSSRFNIEATDQVIEHMAYHIIPHHTISYILSCFAFFAPSFNVLSATRILLAHSICIILTFNHSEYKILR